MTYGEALADAIRRLRKAEITDAPRDARRLLTHAAGIAPGRLLPNLAEPLPAEASERLNLALAKRCQRVPVAQIVGFRDFYGRRFLVGPDVLDPRPETETLIEVALRLPFRRVLDLGTGSGCILLTLLAERQTANGVGTDLSTPALDRAAENARRLAVDARSRFRQGSWYAALRREDRPSFDLIAANPPYIPLRQMASLPPEVRDHEPWVALTDGGDGLGAYRAIVGGCGSWLAPGGRFLVEIGEGQAEAVSALFRDAGLEDVRVISDLDGRSRVVAATSSARRATP